MALSLSFTVNSDGELVLAKGIGDDIVVGSIPTNYLVVNDKNQLVVNTKNIVPERKKVEVYYSFPPDMIMIQGMSYNLINLIKSVTPIFGQLSPFFNVTTEELNCYNEDAGLHFKLNVIGSWSGGSSNKSMQIDFVGTNGNRLVQSRDAAVTSDVLTFNNLFSIDKDGNIATNGTAITIQSNGGDFTIANLLLIAEQDTITDEIL